MQSMAQPLSADSRQQFDSILLNFLCDSNHKKSSSLSTDVRIVLLMYIRYVEEAALLSPRQAAARLSTPVLLFDHVQELLEVC
jgi:hypothetical protein